MRVRDGGHASLMIWKSACWLRGVAAICAMSQQMKFVNCYPQIVRTQFVLSDPEMALALLSSVAAFQQGVPSACIAGGGIGGLFTALTLRKQGYDVAVYEKTKEYRPFGGPIHR